VSSLAWPARTPPAAPAAPRSGQTIPDVAYTTQEVATWDAVLEQLGELLPRHACAEYLRCLPLFDFRPGKASGPCSPTRLPLRTCSAETCALVGGPPHDARSLLHASAPALPRATTYVSSTAAQVPQLSEVQAVLRDTTGWSIRPVAGLMVRAIRISL
jgi:hypothetical protein